MFYLWGSCMLILLSQTADTFLLDATPSVRSLSPPCALGKCRPHTPYARSFSRTGLSTAKALVWVDPPTQDSPSSGSSTLIAFPGGGIYFWWQAGFVQSLQQRQFINTCTMVGASAGALTAVLAGCQIDMTQVYESAYAICERRNVWKQPLGLFGCWGLMPFISFLPLPSSVSLTNPL